MKKIFIAAFLLVSLRAAAQQTELLSRDFWQGNPNISKVKAEVAKGFDFANMQGSADPVLLAISNHAPADVIKYLLEQPGVDLKHTLFEGRSYLHMAAYQGNAEAVECLLDKGADVDFLDANNHTPLSFTAYQGKLTRPVLDVFLKRGLDINKKYPYKNDATLLLLAVGYDKDLSITDYLVSKGASIKAVDKNGNTTFNYATSIGNVDILKALLKKGVKYTDNALFMAAQGTYRSANKIDVYKYLVEDLKIKPTIINKNGQNVLHAVVRKQNQADIITYFFNKGVDINKVDTAGSTPFIGAAGVKSVETVAMLLPKVKNINATNTQGESALTNAVKSADADVVRLLLKNGADVNVKDNEGKNLVFYLVDSYRGAGGRGNAGGGSQAAGGGGQGESIAQNVSRNNGGNTTERQISPADDFGNKLKALQDKGLDIAAPQPDGSTLFHLAIAKNDLELLKKIASFGIDVNAKNDEGLTVLHKAAMLSRNDAILRYLVSLGAKKDIKTSFDETAYDLASENGFLTKEKISIDFLK